MKTIYQERGYDSRTDYLKRLAEDFDVSLEYVLGTAQILGPSEDWDGLVTAVQDMAYMKVASKLHII